MDRDELVERIAARLWKAEAEDTGTPASIVDRRTPEAFAEQREDWRARWHKFALAAAEVSSSDATRIAELEAALNQIDALDPEEHVYGCSADALRGLVIRMGQIARKALEDAS